MNNCDWAWENRAYVHKIHPSHNSTYIIVCIFNTISVNCIKFPITCCTSYKSFIIKLFLLSKLLNFEVQKSGQILCVHKPYFLMLAHNWYWAHIKGCFIVGVAIKGKSNYNLYVYISPYKINVIVNTIFDNLNMQAIYYKSR